MRMAIVVMLLCTLSISAYAQESNPDVKQLERKLDEGTQQVEQLRALIEQLRTDISRLKGETPANEPRPANPSEEPVSQQSSPTIASR